LLKLKIYLKIGGTWGKRIDEGITVITANGTLREVLQELSIRYPDIQFTDSGMDKCNFSCFSKRKLLALDDVISDQSEIYLFPPMMGG